MSSQTFQKSLSLDDGVSGGDEEDANGEVLREREEVARERDDQYLGTVVDVIREETGQVSFGYAVNPVYWHFSLAIYMTLLWQNAGRSAKYVRYYQVPGTYVVRPSPIVV